MLRNEEDYANGETYDPSRFLTPDGKIDPRVRDPFTVAFGFGRRLTFHSLIMPVLSEHDFYRACPGAHIGRSMFWLVAASLATLFKWTEPLGEDGKPIDQPMDYETGMV
jgi:hypothetical protein